MWNECIWEVFLSCRYGEFAMTLYAECTKLIPMLMKRWETIMIFYFLMISPFETMSVYMHFQKVHEVNVSGTSNKENYYLP